MNFKEYQDAAWDFALPSARTFSYVEAGMVGEVGELYSLIAKGDRDGFKEDFRETLIKELGDVLWFLAAWASMYQIELSELAQTNIDKLNKRRELGTIQGSGDNR
jgi:NTP pyrophosphatase (non-canonical NTP hydrolase)